MAIEIWGWIATFSIVLIGFWLAGIGVGSEHEHAWAGWIVGAVPVVGLVVSMVAVIGWLLVK